MASFQAPPGHLSQAEVLILSSLVDYQLTLLPPNADLKVSCCKSSSNSTSQLHATVVHAFVSAHELLARCLITSRWRRSRV